MAAVWEPKQGDTVLIIDLDSNDAGKVGTISQVRTLGDRNYGVTFGDNVLRYFSREGLSLQVSACPGPDYTITDPVPSNLSRLKITRVVLDGTGYPDGVMTVTGDMVDLLALAAELVKRG